MLFKKTNKINTKDLPILEQNDIKSKRRKLIANIFIYLGLFIWAIFVLFPFYWMILSSFKTYSEYNRAVPTFFTLKPTLSNFATAFTSVNLTTYFGNTLYFTILTTVIMLVVIILAAFAFARLDFKGKNIVFVIFLSLMMIPSELVVITNYTTITNLNMRNTFAGLILPSITSIFYIYLLKENFQAIPDELYLASKIDGTSDFNYLRKVMIPMSKPTLVSIVILKVIECWNSYIWPRLATDDEVHFLVSNGIQQIRQTGFGRENIPAMMACVVLVSIPLIVLFLVFKKQIMTGVSRSGTKG